MCVCLYYRINILYGGSYLVKINFQTKSMPWLKCDKYEIVQWRIQRGFRGFARTPEPASSFFKYPMKMKYFGLTETKLFHFHGKYKKNEIKSAKRTPSSTHLNPPPPSPFQKSWIRPCCAKLQRLSVMIKIMRIEA